MLHVLPQGVTQGADDMVAGQSRAVQGRIGKAGELQRKSERRQGGGHAVSLARRVALVAAS